MRATYHTHDGRAVPAFVTSTHEGPDGPQVDLAETDGTAPFIRRAPVAEIATPGHAVLESTPEPVPENAEVKPAAKTRRK